jgi:hypothetical protein
VVGPLDPGDLQSDEDVDVFFVETSVVTEEIRVFGTWPLEA